MGVSSSVTGIDKIFRIWTHHVARDRAVTLFVIGRQQRRRPPFFAFPA